MQRYNWAKGENDQNPSPTTAARMEEINSTKHIKQQSKFAKTMA